jgi:hypothetical protein
MLGCAPALASSHAAPDAVRPVAARRGSDADEVFAARIDAIHRARWASCLFQELTRMTGDERRQGSLVHNGVSTREDGGVVGSGSGDVPVHKGKMRNRWRHHVEEEADLWRDSPRERSQRWCSEDAMAL